ncbi:MAG TPA: ribosomal L7Ae/L30e/S12e/Gadd45 family protein [Candidatus Nanoarchaeia archaeon]|nr:ribosomal L7Ae/L30e/S12e/Gadd45 family protein [Candidatus Nanoarchaeia archaeon]
MDNIAEVKQAIKEGNAVIGLQRTLKLLKQKKIKKIFLASNTAKLTKEDIAHYSKLANVTVADLELKNEDLGTICKKPFSISVISVRSE